MQNITLKIIKQTYNKIKILAQKAYNKGDYELSMRHIETAAEIAYQFNWIYTDKDLELILTKISKKIINQDKDFIPRQGRIVFYDVFAFDNKGLTQQYLRALMSWGVELLFVYEGNDLSKSKNIIKELNAYPQAEIFTVDSNLAATEKIKLIYNKVILFSPEKAFLHLHPSSVIAVTLWNSLPKVTRYLVNLTDHAFWLGKQCSDYSLEFRDYGYTVSLEKRLFNKEQLLVQPYYPIVECDTFKGFPEQVTNNSTVIFSGGQYYKMYGKDDRFFDILKSLVEIDSSVIILIAGSGDVSPLQKFISRSNYENRILLIGSRTDINPVFENCDIYLSTYPMTGGLMGQFAAANSKPILSYTSSDIRCNFTEGFLGCGEMDNYKITYTQLDEFYAEASKLVGSEIYRHSCGKENKSHLITEEEFSIQLKELVTYNKNKTSFNIEKIDYDVFSSLYLERENMYLKQFDFFIISRFKSFSLFLFPLRTFSFIFSTKCRKLFVDIILKKIHSFFN